MPRFDVRCLEEGCGHLWVASKAFDEWVQCPRCYSGNTKTLMPRVQGLDRAKDPFDLIGMGQKIPASKKVKSFANDRRKGGKDTT